MSRRWCTKEDVLKDLELVSGHVPTNVDDGCFMYGDLPPPPPACNVEDEEFKLRFGPGAALPLDQGDQNEPDLIGITEMLRMVQKTEHSSDEGPPETPTKSYVITKANNITSGGRTQHDVRNKPISPNMAEIPSHSKITPKRKLLKTEERASPSDKKIGTSQLNPEVKEFVPKSLISPNRNVDEINNVTTTNENRKDRLKADSSNETKKQMAMLLKDQISAKSDTFEEKQQSNKAIVSLLKLYADPKPAKPMKLLPPEYFEKSQASNSKNEIDDLNKGQSFIQRMASLHNVDDANDKINYRSRHPNSSKESMSVLLGSEKSDMLSDVSNFKENDGEMQNDSVQNVDDDTNTSYDRSSAIKEYEESDDTVCDDDNIQEFSMEETQLTPDMGDIRLSIDVEPSENIQIMDPDMKESISKVKNWLQDKPVVTVTTKPRSPMLHPGAVAYKRKDPASCKSPIEMTEKKVSKVSEFKPSSDADEFYKKYSERTKVIPAPTVTTWDTLAADLERRDLEIKNRKKVSELSSSKRNDKS